MKKLFYIGFLLLALVLASCGGNGSETVDAAFQAIEKGDGAKAVADILADGDIDCAKLSEEDFGKLGLCLVYVAATDASGEQIERLSGLCNKYDKAGEDMTEAQLQEAEQCAVNLIPRIPQPEPVAAPAEPTEPAATVETTEPTETSETL